ncbi:pyruvate formate-lyase activating enzyme [Klebsiella pneumoniae subsp. pneumoniae]|uniref:Pyruvate formate-lyase activating enzyme n=1 Tax=Klebsiella pneumoniae subsp. pneumoniae TaxID=72407 RepID=A0A378A1F4_KLEPN|nr:pyruvate formate-lyase activating enzyme [Klebsiella pneumoniae subsp. pneumoniae]
MGEEYKLDGVHPPKKETMERVKGILEQYGHKVNVLIPPGPVMRLCRPATAWEAVSAPPFHSHEKRLVLCGSKPMRLQQMTRSMRCALQGQACATGVG